MEEINSEIGLTQILRGSNGVVADPVVEKNHADNMVTKEEVV
jgi:hypothetical protein